jgi:hypothetical protein
MTTHKVLFAIGLFYIAVSISVLGLASTGFGSNLNVLDLLLGNNSATPGVETNVQGATNQSNEGDSALLGLMAQNGLTGTITSTNTVSGGLKVATVIAKFFGVPVSDVLKLKSDGMGYGEIFKLYEIHVQSGQPLTAVLSLRNSGMGWGQINHDLGLPPGNHGKNLGSAVSGHVTQSVTTTITSTLPTRGNGKGNGNPNPPGKNKP